MRWFSRRASIALFALTGGLLLFIIASHVFAFVRIFLPHAGIAVTQEEVAAAHRASGPDTRPQVIPKIMHQVFHNWREPGNEKIPEDWDEVRQTCKSVNKDWEYKLWTESASRKFIETEYPWFLKTYEGYRFPVQRVDALRYFLMRHYGGLYIDLDNGCLENLDPLLYYPVFVTDGGHGALSNNILGAEPGHPFWVRLTDSLMPYNWNYIFPYVIISYASGQWFLTAMWEAYHAQEAGKRGALYRVMMDMRPGAAKWVFFNQNRGNSWVNWDNHLFKEIGDHWMLVVFGGVALGILFIWVPLKAWSAYRRMKGYSRLAGQVPEPRPEVRQA